MKNCTKCTYASWQRTETGKLHPSGNGKCAFEYKIPPLPACMYWMNIIAPRPCGGYINRREDNKEHCTYYQEAK